MPKWFQASRHWRKVIFLFLILFLRFFAVIDVSCFEKLEKHTYWLGWARCCAPGGPGGNNVPVSVCGQRSKSGEETETSCWFLPCKLINSGENVAVLSLILSYTEASDFSIFLHSFLDVVSLMLPLFSVAAGIRAGRKLRILRRKNRWASKVYNKSHSITAMKANPMGGSSMAKGIVLEKIGVEAKQPNSAIRKCVRVQLIKNGKKIAAFVPRDGCLNFVDENVSKFCSLNCIFPSIVSALSIFIMCE